MVFPLLQGAKESEINPSGINHSERKDNHQKKCRDNQSQENAEINRSSLINQDAKNQNNSEDQRRESTQL
jgi:hypothetical protein